MLKISNEKAAYSKIRLNELKTRLGKLSEIESLPGLTAFGAGSYARLEASKHSDIDMFFLRETQPGDKLKPKTNSLRMFGKIIDLADTMGFPEFSNDSEYLVVIEADKLRNNLGSRTDDHENHFTARMLLLLESHCLYGDDVYKRVIESVVGSYFKDFPDHQQTFQPVFLLNDICRFWKTLLLNYEHKRNGSQDDGDTVRKTKQKVRNFKLKYSRLTTCYASAVAFGSFSAPVTEKHIIDLISLTPRQRLESVANRLPVVKPQVNELLEQYEWFLEMTDLPTGELESKFSDKQKRTEMFSKANEYGETMFRLIQAVDATDKNLRLLRLLVV